MSTLANRLKQLRTDSNLLQKDIASKLNITSSAYGYYEQGKRIPDSNTLNSLADFYNVSTDYILGRTDTQITNLTTNNSLNHIDFDKTISYDDILNYVDKHLANLPEAQKDYLVKQVNEKYWNSKNIEQKVYPSQNKQNKQ